MKLSRLLFLLTSFLVLSCSESNNRTTYEIKSENVVFIDDDKTTFEQGDYLWLNIKIPSTQVDDLTGRSLDIFELTKANETFFGFSLFAENGDGFTPVRFEVADIEIQKGLLNVIDYREPANTELLGVAQYMNGNYEMRAGIPLNTIGKFFLANTELGSGTQGMAFNPANGSDIQISLSTKIQSSNSEGRYYLSVN
ncbi:hypothetical protein LVD13_04940 [Flavobacteriaceae bacterium D16]|nr:hypothetical protein [Flavobacteriaceae bacterium D16]